MSEMEYDTKFLKLDATFQDEVKKLDAEGWQVAQTFTPMAIYHVCRNKDAAARPQPLAGMGGMGGLGIDESKIHIIGPDGQRKN